MRADLDQTLAALADLTRRATIELLRGQAWRASDLADSLSLSRPVMSKHLRILRTAGIVEQEILDSDARVRMVRLRQEPFSILRGWVEDVESYWGEQLAAFQSHVEAKSKSKTKSRRKKGRA